MLKACDQFAIEVNRPELKHAPFVLWGHSMGGRVAQDFVRFQPSRVLAFHIALRANPSDAEFMQEEANSIKVPGLYLMGELDRKPEDIRKHFHHSREAKSPRAWICFQVKVTGPEACTSKRMKRPQKIGAPGLPMT